MIDRMYLWKEIYYRGIIIGFLNQVYWFYFGVKPNIEEMVLNVFK